MCIQSDYELLGQSFYSLNLKFLQINLWKCQNQTASNRHSKPINAKNVHNEGVICKSPQEIDDYLGAQVFSFAFVNQIFELTTYDNTTMSFIDDSLFFELSPGMVKYANFYVQQSKVHAQDDIWLGRQHNFTFPEVQNINQYTDDYDANSGQLCVVYVRLDKAYSIYDREVQDILTLIAAIGGL